MNAKQISLKAEVDLEMVRACLRVLKHHGIIALVSQFNYSNRYEFTPKATAMLAGKEPRLLQDALEYSLKRSNKAGNSTSQSNASHSHYATGTTAAVGQQAGSLGSEHGSNRPATHTTGSVSAHFTPSSYPPRTMGLLGGSQQSYSFRSTMVMAESMDREASTTSRRAEENRIWKSAIAELYCACNRNVSFGDLWLSLAAEAPTQVVTVPNQAERSGKSNRHPGSMQRHLSSRRKESIAEDFPGESVDNSSAHATSSLVESLALSPSETHRLESLRQGNGLKAGFGVNWDDFFKQIDHRRFLTFGLIHGLLERVHAFPCFPYPFPDVPESRSASPASGSGDMGIYANTWSQGSMINPSTTASVTSGFAGNFGHKQSLKKRFLEQKAHKFARNVAQMMDGRRCDDELACYFEKPYKKLTELVENYGERKVITFYAEFGDN